MRDQKISSLNSFFVYAVVLLCHLILLPLIAIGLITQLSNLCSCASIPIYNDILIPIILQ